MVLRYKLFDGLKYIATFETYTAAERYAFRFNLADPMIEVFDSEPWR